MFLKFNSFGCFLLPVLVSAPILAQVRPDVPVPLAPIRLGVELSTFNSDYGCNEPSTPVTCWTRQLQGLGVVADADNLYRKFGIQGEARWLDWRGPANGIVEANYLAGPSYRMLVNHRFSVYAKVILGGAGIRLPVYGERYYLAYAPGAKLRYAMNDRLSFFLDYEYQIWPMFSGIASQGNKGLTPTGFSIGATCLIFRR